MMAAAHALSFERPWSAEEFADLLSAPGVFALGGPQGFIVCRTVIDEAEVLTLAVDPAARRAGLGRALVELAMGVAVLAGAGTAFLEVAEDNPAARALYAAAGFSVAGRRRGYYARPDRAVDAVVMRRDLNSGQAAAYGGVE
jgi:ribosomal-protein-alanine N-acetyltransferase